MQGLARRYFLWLYDQACDVNDLDSPYSYAVVCDYMHQIAFKAIVPHDDNRAAYGIGLRNDFMLQERRFPTPRELYSVMGPDASILEVLVGLAKQANFMIELSEKTWFNIFITNLNLAQYNDAAFNMRHKWRIIKILERFNNRTYSPNGRGGLFPLRRPDEDQRDVEIWYQMAAYMTEKVMY